MTHGKMLLYLLALALLSVCSGQSQQQQECNENTVRGCKKRALENLDGDRQCNSIREDFDCLLWQTSMCLDKDGQDSNRDTISRIWRYLQSFCESQGNWYTKPCFQRDDVRRCEGLLPPSRGFTTDSASCRDFSSFRECVTSVVLIDCSTADRRLMGTYLMEKGQQRAWNCPRSTSSHRIHPTSASLAAEDMDSSGVSYGVCSDEARVALRECRTEFYSEQKEATTRNDSDMRHHGTCCALVRYEECVGRTLRERCASESRARSEARSLVSDMKQRFPYHSCEDHTINECSGSSTVALCASLLFLALLLLRLQKQVIL